MRVKELDPKVRFFLFFAIHFVHQIPNSYHEMQDDNGKNDNRASAHRFFY